jgi:hypothetical protein
MGGPAAMRVLVRVQAVANSLGVRSPWAECGRLML